jgi:hypothetical protein
MADGRKVARNRNGITNTTFFLLSARRQARKATRKVIPAIPTIG